MKEHTKQDILTFVCAYGDNPQIFESIASVRKNFPGKRIVIWHDCPETEEHSKKVEAICDDYIKSNSNFGTCKGYGWALTYLEYDYILLFGDDCILPDDYATKIMPLFQNEKVAVVGELWNLGFKLNQYVMSDKTNMPDGPNIIRKKAINDVGSLCPEFGMLAHHFMELQERMLDAGWILLGGCSGAKHLGHYTTQKYRSKEFNDSDMERSNLAWKRSKDRKKWWENTL